MAPHAHKLIAQLGGKRQHLSTGINSKDDYTLSFAADEGRQRAGQDLVCDSDLDHWQWPMPVAGLCQDDSEHQQHINP